MTVSQLRRKGASLGILCFAFIIFKKPKKPSLVKQECEHYFYASHARLTRCRHILAIAANEMKKITCDAAYHCRPARGRRGPIVQRGVVLLQAMRLTACDEMKALFSNHRSHYSSCMYAQLTCYLLIAVVEQGQQRKSKQQDPNIESSAIQPGGQLCLIAAT